MAAPRYFNRFSAAGDLITKSSYTYPEMILQEINWYKSVPEWLKNHCPAIEDYDENPDTPSIKMQTIKDELLASLLVQDIINPEMYDSKVQDSILLQLNKILFCMRSIRIDKDTESDCRKMYIEKTLERMPAVCKLLDETNVVSSPWDCLRDNFILDGKLIFGFSYFSNTFIEHAERISKNCRYFSLIHGDLHMSNMFFNPNTTKLTLIDPRGKFGDLDIHGDPRYDWAKLFHSIVYDYDFVIFDKHYIRNIEEYNGNIPIINRKNQINKTAKDFKEKFIKFAADNCPFDRNDIDLICALLFISMIPLHADRTDHQLAFLIKGLEIYTTYLEQNGFV